jgi:phosphatidylinositol alpha-1,6-mannosyltransferase
MPAAGDRRSILLGLTGLEVDGGIASVSRCIARTLDECTESGRLDLVDRVLLLDDDSHPPAPPHAGAQWLARGSKRRFVWQLWRAFRRGRHDLVLFDHLGLARATNLPLPSFPPHQTAIFIHGLELASAQTGARVRPLANASILLANSEFTASAVRRHLPARADRVRVTPLCIDPQRIEAWEKVCSHVPDPPRVPAALIVARMWSEERGKGHDDLIAAWSAVRAQAPEAELWMVGDGDDRSRLEDRTRSLGLSAAVRFWGRVSDDDLCTLYRRARLFAMPSRQEGFGLVYAEAMWHGLPCIGSTADAAGQVIVAGETGLLVPFGDVAAISSAVAALLNDPARAERMGEAGRRRAREQFSYARFRCDLLTALDLG